MIRVFYFYIMIDFLIVGNALAGVCFAEVALQKQKPTQKSEVIIKDFGITFNDFITKSDTLKYKRFPKAPPG